MFSTSDTIVAIATAPGRGGIGVVRLSGPDALAVTHALIGSDVALVPRHATLTTILERPRHHTATVVPAILDRVIVTYFPAPHSYTGDDVVEVSAHGSPVVMNAIVASAIECGARLAEPGEFTLRAFVNGRIDLPQAEAVADLIEAATPLQARAAFDQLNGTLTRAIGAIDEQLFDLIARLEASVDFPDEGYRFVARDELVHSLDRLLDQTTALLGSARRGRLIREGLQIAIVGRPNVGKSSLFNALVGTARAIVSDTPGTTRDLVTETIDLDGLRVTLVDTAGLRPTSDGVEAEGVGRAQQAARVADLILEVRDASVRPLDESAPSVIGVEYTLQTTDNKRLIVFNKCDLQQRWVTQGGVEVSAVTGLGMDGLRARIAEALDVDRRDDPPGLTNIRHVALVESAHQAISRGRAAVVADLVQLRGAESNGARSLGAVAQIAPLSEEFVLADLQAARNAFEEITGRRSSDDLLHHIFSRFCIGK